jgi:hypothetical protein
MITPDGSNYQFSNRYSLASNITVPADSWTFVAATYDGAYMKIYLNGILDSTKAETGHIFVGTERLFIGYCEHSDPSETYFDGVIDEVKIYDYSRTSEEILNDYNSFMPSPSPFWTEWWFWAIIALGVVTGVFAFTTVHYHKKASIPKDSKVTSTKPAQKKDFKVCSNCGASLPLDSVFCGKCGTRQE